MTFGELPVGAWFRTTMNPAVAWSTRSAAAVLYARVILCLSRRWPGVPWPRVYRVALAPRPG